MRTLNISISDVDYDKYGIKNENLSFSDFVDIVGRELARQNLKKATELSERFGLAGMTMEEISAEVKAIRNDEGHS